MKILVFGRGFIGSRVSAQLGAEMAASRIEDAGRELDELGPDVVINCAGFAGVPNVDACERAAFTTCWANTYGAIALAAECQKRGIYLLHLSSGCIFQGPSPTPGGWKEGDFAYPQSTYACSKWTADLALRELPNVAIVRIRMPLDGRPHPRNLITKLAAYKQVIDVVNSVTVLDDLILVMRRLVAVKGTGIFHATNPGTVSHRGILEAYRACVDPDHKTEWIESEGLVRRGLALRPRSNCQLGSERLEGLGIQMRPIAEALPIVMKSYALSV